MEKHRLEAFSDGVLAIIITIMVLELPRPDGATVAALRPVVPIFLSYVLSFAYVGIYWNNHHHMLHTVKTITGPVLWANLHLLFWLSLIPFVTAWSGETHFAPIPTSFYGAVLLMSAVAYTVLQNLIIRDQGSDSVLRRAIGNARKEKLSMGLYVLSVPAAFASQWISQGIFVLVALIWLVPDRRIERELEAERVRHGRR